MQPSVYLNRQLNKKESLNDVAATYDIEAIKDSIATAFTTAPGDKILNPRYGIDLRQYVFERVDSFTTALIKEDILEYLPIMEPRVEVQNVTVTEDPDNNSYYIALQINVPTLDIYGLSIKSELNSTGYSIL